MKLMVKVGLTAITSLWMTAAIADGGVGGSSSNAGTGLGLGDTEATVTENGVHLAIEGDAARTVYDGLDVEERGPFSTGLCIPGMPCDPPTFWGKDGASVSCSKVEYAVSGRIEYTCQLLVDAVGAVSRGR
jgi:hypothetical protein